MGRARAGNAAEGGTDRHPDASQVALAEHVAGHHLASNKKVGARPATEMHRGVGIYLQPEIGEGDPRTQGEGIERRRIDWARPVRLWRRQPLGAAVVEHGMIEGADLAGRVVGMHGRFQPRRIEAGEARKFAQRVGLEPREDGRHEAPDGLGVDDRGGDLPRLPGDQSAPDGVTLGPEVLTLVVETFAVAIDHDAERNAIDARADAAIVQRSPRVDGHAM